MRGTRAPSRAAGLELGGTSLLVPALHPEPLPIRVIPPAPCTQACPADVNVKAYVSLIAEGRFGDALEVVRRRCPLPGICGRICHAPCERACKRRAVDEPLAVRSLKRFVADLEAELPPPPAAPDPHRPWKVAVVGSGPAGLTAAYDLRLAGFPVTVFEAEAEPGGMLRYGITAYRLPREVLDAEIRALCSAGLEIQTGRRIGRDLDLEELAARGYDAVLFAVGAQRGRRLGLPGEEGCRQVEDALAFLRRVNEGDRSPVTGRVVVIGGGSTAVEAARTALRLGAESVEILYRRYREELLASHEEVKAAESEGVGFRFLVAPSRVLTESGRLTGLECVQVGLGEPDASGRRRPIYIPQSEFPVDADLVLAAVGQEVDLGLVSEEVRPRLSHHGLLQIDSRTSMTALQGVFAAGDAVSGPATVIEAIASGHRAAEAIRHYLEEGKPEIREERPERRAALEYGLPDNPPLEAMRVRPALVGLRPGREFSEVEKAFSAADAVAEARRCLRCGPCGECRICAPSCQRRHVMLRVRNGEAGAATVLLRAPASIALNLRTDRVTRGRLLPHAEPRLLPEVQASEGRVVELLPVRAGVQERFCRACGRCVEVCPFAAITLRDASDPADRAQIQAALCRGCNLCTAVCPTDAATPTALSPEWWGSRLEDAFSAPAVAAGGQAPFLVLACQRRAGALEEALEQHGVHVEVIRFRCVGQVDAGMLMELYRHRARGVLVAGCLTDRCRFGSGARLATEQVARAQTMLRLMGEEAGRIWSDWSGERAADPLDLSVLRMVAESLEVEASRRRPAAS